MSKGLLIDNIRATMTVSASQEKQELIRKFIADHKLKPGNISEFFFYLLKASSEKNSAVDALPADTSVEKNELANLQAKAELAGAQLRESLSVIHEQHQKIQFLEKSICVLMIQVYTWIQQEAALASGKVDLQLSSQELAEDFTALFGDGQILFNKSYEELLADYPQFDFLIPVQKKADAQ
jgi:hypothetical protein